MLLRKNTELQILQRNIKHSFIRENYYGEVKSEDSEIGHTKFRED